MGAKLSIVLPNLAGGGVERVRLGLAEEFVRRGHEVEFVLLRAQGALLSDAQARFRVRTLECVRLRQAPQELVKYLRQRRPDALLAAMWPLSAIGGLAGYLAGGRTRVVVSEHNDFRMVPAIGQRERWILKHFGRRIYRPCHNVVAVSDGVAESLREVVGLDEARLRVIHNPLRAGDSGSLAKEDREKVAGWLNGKVRVVGIGTLKPQKGHDVLLRSLVELRERVDAKLLILGEGPLRAELERLAVQLGIEDQVWMPGFRNNPGAFLQHADVFALSSNWEGFGNVIVEALNAGVPVVSTDCRSGPAEILGNGRYGRLVPVGDAEALANGIEETVAAPAEPDLLRKRASDFSPEKIARAYLDLLLPPGA